MMDLQSVHVYLHRQDFQRLDVREQDNNPHGLYRDAFTCDGDPFPIPTLVCLSGTSVVCVRVGSFCRLWSAAVQFGDETGFYPHGLHGVSFVPQLGKFVSWFQIEHGLFLLQQVDGGMYQQRLEFFAFRGLFHHFDVHDAVRYLASLPCFVHVVTKHRHSHGYPHTFHLGKVSSRGTFDPFPVFHVRHGFVRRHVEEDLSSCLSISHLHHEGRFRHRHLDVACGRTSHPTCFVLFSICLRPFPKGDLKPW
mmetsp:Transcript_10190/g.62112  ORF Transcript_10190/g.62112 Transcript_10190/m.62112 type:complete len:250 (-) Transcript_10190:52-801(-)